MVSLVSNDYDDVDDDNELNTNVVSNTHKRTNTHLDSSGGREEKRRKDDEDDPPPLPESFNNVTVPKIRVTTSPDLPRKHKDKDIEMMEDPKLTLLIPPQIRKKKSNISTEDTSSWMTVRTAKTRKPPIEFVG